PAVPRGGLVARRVAARADPGGAARRRLRPQGASRRSLARGAAARLCGLPATDSAAFRSRRLLDGVGTRIELPHDPGGDGVDLLDDRIAAPVPDDPLDLRPDVIGLEDEGGGILAHLLILV